MSKKKKSKRKQNFAYSKATAKPTLIPEPKQQAETELPKAAAKPEQAIEAVASKDNFLAHDLKKIAVLAASSIILELAVWLFLQHSSIGGRILGI